jgi:hypothetical protein
VIASLGWEKMRREGIPKPRDVFKATTYWRMRGEEVRTLAEDTKDPTSEAIRIADNSDRLAAHAHEITALALEARVANERGGGAAGQV